MSACTPRIGIWAVIVTFPALAFALADVFRRSGAAGSGDGRLRPQPQQSALQRQPVQSVLVQAE